MAASKTLSVVLSGKDELSTKLTLVRQKFDKIAESSAPLNRKINEIKKQMGEEWKFMMRQWADNISLERQRINAMRDISIAYANSQSKTEVTNVFWK